jgi:HEAT repeat protein
MLWWTYQQLRVSAQKTRLAVIEKLTLSEDPDSVGPLVFALKDRDAEVREAAVRSLGKFKVRATVDPLMQLLRDPAAQVRTAAAESLGKIGDPTAVNWLVGLLRDTDPTVRSAASRSLQQLGWRPGSDSQRVLQILAMGNLAQVASMGPEAIDPLAEMLRTGTPDKQFAAIKALGDINDPRVTRVMVEALGKPSPGVRIAALGFLERYADPSTYEAVERLLKDSNPGIRGAVIEAMARCGGQRAVPALIRAVKDTSWEVRNAAVKALGALGATAAVDAICQLMRDPDRDVRESAVVTLGRIGSRRATGALILAMLDVESVVRSAAAVSLRQVNRQWDQSEAVQEVLPQLKNALNHPEYWVRHSALKIFEQLKIDPLTVEITPPAPKPSPQEPAPPAIFPILADMLFDRDRDLRLAAAVAFIQVRDKNAESILAAAVLDTDPSVQAAAKQARAALN